MNEYELIEGKSVHDPPALMEQKPTDEPKITP